MLNNWCGQGRLAKDVELRYTATQVPVASFSIACDRDFAAKDGTRETDWIDIVAWNKSAEFVSKYFHKGDMILVNGRIQTRAYEDKNGNKRKAVEIIGTSFNFCGKKSDGNQGENQTSGYGQPQGGYQNGYGGQGNYQNGYGGQGNYQNANRNRQPQGGQDPLDGFMSIPDGIDEELPFM